jgi:hypothetical protein
MESSIVQAAYWVIGAGRVGRHAVERLLTRSGRARIVLVDAAPEVLKGDWPESVQRVCADGVAYLLDRLAQDQTPDPWIVPALPIHLAGAWIRSRLRQAAIEVQTIEIPEAVCDGLPNRFPGETGLVYCSQADFRCPDNCVEGPVCPHTGRSRPLELYKYLHTLAPPGFQATVIQSRQLAPGLGGYRATALREALDAIRRRPGRHLLATACKCHGVIEAFATRSVRAQP